MKQQAEEQANKQISIIHNEVMNDLTRTVLCICFELGYIVHDTSDWVGRCRRKRNAVHER